MASLSYTLLFIPCYRVDTPKLNAVQKQYEAILKQFPGLFRPTLINNKIKNQGIEHFIKTKETSITARAWRLSSEKLKAAKEEIDFMIQVITSIHCKNKWMIYHTRRSMYITNSLRWFNSHEKLFPFKTYTNIQ